MFVLCLHCQCTFKTFPSLRRKYCSLSCYQAAHASHEERICLRCGLPFIRMRSQLDKPGYGQYCSQQCSAHAQSQRLSLACLSCKKSFAVTPSRKDARYCSNACFARSKDKGPYSYICALCNTPFLRKKKRTKTSPYIYCSRRCTGLAKRAHWATRFWSYVDKKEAYECWPWRGAHDQDGYGTYRFTNETGYQSRRAHQVAYELTFGSWPQGKQGCHTCDNPCCCNPKHLYPGTVKENMRDRRERGRDLRGERSPRAKLTDTIVREILESPLETATLARRYHVAWNTIESVRQRKTWTHIEIE